MSKTIRLAIYFDDELRAIKELVVPVVIGRSRDVNLTIPHPMVSRRHCFIYEEKGTVRLQDLGSLNGTYRGRERVTDLVLEDGTEFLIGNIRFVVNPADTVKSAIFPVSPGSDFVKTEITPDDIPPPLPPLVIQPAEADSSTNLPSAAVISPPAAPVSPTTPSFIKPLSLPPLPPQDAGNNVVDLSDVIDLASISDKEVSTPPPLRESK